MVHRDPDTGKFVSDDDDGMDYVDVDGTEVYTGQLSTEVAAADLSTGEDSVTIDGEAAEVIDFTQYLSSDEVFVCHAIELTVTSEPDRTASAEHNFNIQYTARRNSEPLLGTGQPDQPSGIGITAATDSAEDDVLLSGLVNGAGDFADSASGVSGGQDAVNQVRSFSWVQNDLPAPAFDQDDEVYIPHYLVIRGSDDQTFGCEFIVTLYGKTYDY